MSMTPNTAPRCSFSVRYPVDGGKWVFERLLPATWDTSGSPALEYPPPNGVLVVLHDVRSEGGPSGGPLYRVIDQMWTYPDYGSGSWPLGEPKPLSGPLVTIIVEPADGLFIDEAPGDEDGDS